MNSVCDVARFRNRLRDLRDRWYAGIRTAYDGIESTVAGANIVSSSSFNAFSVLEPKKKSGVRSLVCTFRRGKHFPNC